MLMSRIIRFPAARKSCCISAFCDVTHVALTACLNIESAAASSTSPTAIDTISSTRVKPRVVRSVRCMSPLLVIYRDVFAVDVSFLNRRVRTGVQNGHRDLVQGLDGISVHVKQRLNQNL